MSLSDANAPQFELVDESTPVEPWVSEDDEDDTDGDEGPEDGI